ncbi:MAG: hypothetical protein GY851_29745 [bacterium]|nr:hypothetical protein [bacterium]
MEIRIGKTGRKCSGSDRPFVHGETVTSLVRLEEQTLSREDYSQECWTQERAGGSLAVWSTVYHDPEVERQEPPEAYSPLRQIFYELVEADDRKSLATAYLAAQLLRRQKVFRLLKESDDAEGDARIALFTDRIADRLIEVRDPNLTYAEMEAGRQDLVVRLAELEAPEEPETEEPAPGADDVDAQGEPEKPESDTAEGHEPEEGDSEEPAGDEESEEQESDEAEDQEA